VRGVPPLAVPPAGLPLTASLSGSVPVWVCVCACMGVVAGVMGCRGDYVRWSFTLAVPPAGATPHALLSWLCACLCPFVSDVFVRVLVGGAVGVGGAEVITCAEFHPSQCHLLAYSSSKGTIRLIDMRDNALCDRHSKL